MSSSAEHHLIIRIARLRTPGLVDTLSNQAPDIARGVEDLAQQAFAEAEAMAPDGWQLISHSVEVTAGLAILTLVVAR